MIKSTFRPSRILYRSEMRDTNSVQIGVAGWYFQARQGKEFGPFDTRGETEAALLKFVRACIKQCDTGGRALQKTAS